MYPMIKTSILKQMHPNRKIIDLQANVACDKNIFLQANVPNDKNNYFHANVPCAKNRF